MTVPVPKITSNGDGMWASSSPVSPEKGSAQNALSDVGKTVSAGATFSGNPTSPGVGPRGGSPDPSLLGGSSAGGSRGPGAGASGPSPDQSLLSTKGDSAGVAIRKPSFGGMEKGVLIP